MVEKTILNTTHRTRLVYDLQDLSQMVYLILLEYDPDTIVKIWQSEEMGNFLVGIIRKQLFSRSSPYYYDIIRPGEADEVNERIRAED